MVATRGPVPRSGNYATAKPSKPPKPRSGLHPLALHWYRSLARSDQSRYYRPSDWAAALTIAEAMDTFARKPSASLLQSIMAGWTVLLVTEGDRRRMGQELAAATGVTPLDEVRRRREAKRAAS